MRRLFASVLSGLVLVCVACGPSRAEEKPTAPDAVKAPAAAPTEVIVIGTLEVGHNSARWYTTAELKRILLALKPSAICVELFSKDINLDGSVKPEVIKGAYSPEIAATDEAARALGIKQIAFDREDRNEHWTETNYWERWKRFNKQQNDWFRTFQDLSTLDAQLAVLFEPLFASEQSLTTRGSAEAINSDAFDGLIRIKRSLGDIVSGRFVAAATYPEAKEDYRVLDTDWQDRNQIMADNIARIAADFSGKRIVVTVGASHRYILRERLAGRPGIVLKEFWEVLPEPPTR